MDDFSEYETEFRRLTGTTRRQLQDLESDSTLRGEKRKSFIHDTQRMLQAAEVTLNNMEGELRRLPELTSQIQPKLRKHQQELDSLKRDLARNKNSGSDRNDLLNGAYGSDDLQDWSMNQRNKLMDGVDRLGDASASIERSSAVQEETNDLAREIKMQLGHQGDQLKNAGDNLYVIEENMSTSRKILRGMYRKVISNKLVLLAIILMELATVGIVVYFRFFHN